MSPAETLRSLHAGLRRYRGSTIVVKYGGAAMIDEGLKGSVMEDVALLDLLGVRVALVHGGGPEISAALKRAGKESLFVHGLRYTDADTIDIVEMVLAGKTNKRIVNLLQRAGSKAVGISGKDGNLLSAVKTLSRGVDVGFVGEVTKVNPALLDVLSSAGYVPVICSVTADAEGQTLNINADHVAGHIAAAVGAKELILLSDIPGVRSDPTDPDTIIADMDVVRAKKMLTDGSADKGMIPKLEACLFALSGECERVRIIDGRVPNATLSALFSDTSGGTVVTVNNNARTSRS